MIAALNTNSLVAHIDERRVFMSSSEIDILTTKNKTKLNYSVDNNEIHLQGFDIVRKDRITNGRNGGGVCIYVRDNLNYIIRDDLSPDSIECLIIEITNPQSKPFLVGTWYRPPDSLISKTNLTTDFVADSLIGNPCRVRISINKIRREIRFRIVCSIGNPKIQILRSKSRFPNRTHPKFKCRKD